MKPTPPETLRKWRAEGFTSDYEIDQWVEHGFSIQAAKEWMRATKGPRYPLSIKGAAEWREAGFSPREAAAWAEKGKALWWAEKQRAKNSREARSVQSEVERGERWANKKAARAEQEERRTPTTNDPMTEPPERDRQVPQLRRSAAGDFIRSGVGLVVGAIVVIGGIWIGLILIHSWSHGSCSAPDNGSLGYNSDTGNNCVCSWWSCHDVATP